MVIIRVTEDGPYRVEGEISIRDTEGNELRREGIWHLCRCGGSRNKPFCDSTHGLKGWSGPETAPQASDQRETYDAEGITLTDDRSVCAHFGQCTDRLPRVFRADEEPFVDPSADSPAQIAEVVRGCPSGALALPAEEHDAPSITPIVDGPYRVRGAVQVIGANNKPYSVREKQTLCRCGHSRNKPFCDGSHWYAGFRDPVPPELDNTPTLFEWIGGIAALERLTTAFYDGILNEPDELLEPVFRGMDPDHPKHVAAWLAETFGGPADYTAHHGGYEHMVHAHMNRALTEEQRVRWVALLARTADQVLLPDDPDTRQAFVSYLEWGSRIAVFNSQPGVEIIEHAPVPRWGWGNSAPYVPQPWEADQTDRKSNE
ncbi:CDGSH iron-sulfur domain-containing protein [Actinoplanes sp. CA-142083]|uniref:CDGSH iron-sulfur domain-containing protein n=1 Tax=Actinoplanes sp. CA-142083 TaxID=3239903 RepID=UPI003D90EA23